MWKCGNLFNYGFIAILLISTPPHGEYVETFYFHTPCGGYVETFREIYL